MSSNGSNGFWWWARLGSGHGFTTLPGNTEHGMSPGPRPTRLDGIGADGLDTVEHRFYMDKG